MYKFGAILVCILTGLMVGKYGWTSIIWVPIGYLFGLMALSP